MQTLSREDELPKLMSQREDPAPLPAAPAAFGTEAFLCLSQCSILSRNVGILSHLARTIHRQNSNHKGSFCLQKAQKQFCESMEMLIPGLGRKLQML